MTRDASAHELVRRVYAYAEKQLASGASVQSVRDTLLSKGATHEIVESVLGTLTKTEPLLPAEEKNARNHDAKRMRLALLGRLLAFLLASFVLSSNKPLSALLLLVALLGHQRIQSAMSLWRLAATSLLEKPSNMKQLVFLLSPLVAILCILSADWLGSAGCVILRPLNAVELDLSNFALQCLGFSTVRSSAGIDIPTSETDLVVLVQLGLDVAPLWPVVMWAAVAGWRWWQALVFVLSAVPIAVICNVVVTLVECVMLSLRLTVSERFVGSITATMLMMSASCLLLLLETKLLTGLFRPLSASGGVVAGVTGLISDTNS